MKMVLNECSAVFPLEEKREGRHVMGVFLHTYWSMARILNENTVYMDKDYNGIYLEKNYNILSWRNDPEVDREEKRVLRSLLNRSLTYDYAMTHEEWDGLCEKDLRVGGSSSLGCLCGYLLDGCMLSFDTDEKWNTVELEAVFEHLEEGEICEEDVALRNVSNEETVQAFKTRYTSELKNEQIEILTTGDMILQKNEQLFPNLVFCDNARRQLKNICNHILVKQIAKKLMELQEYFSHEHTYFDKKAIKNADPESRETLRRYEKEHTFRLPDGRKEVFSCHVRFTGIEGRIFFWPDIRNRRCYIGHVGCKLPNVTYH